MKSVGRPAGHCFPHQGGGRRIAANCSLGDGAPKPSMYPASSLFRSTFVGDPGHGMSHRVTCSVFSQPGFCVRLRSSNSSNEEPQKTRDEHPHRTFYRSHHDGLCLCLPCIHNAAILHRRNECCRKGTGSRRLAITTPTSLR